MHICSSFHSKLGDTYFYGGRQGVVDIRLKSNPVLSAAFVLENVPLLYFALSCAIVAAAVKGKLYYDARQVVNNATYVRTTKKDMWKNCVVKNINAYLARRKVLLQTGFESIGCQMLSVQWNEAATEPVMSSVVVMTVDTTNAVIKVIMPVVAFKFRYDFVAVDNCDGSCSICFQRFQDFLNRIIGETHLIYSQL